MIKHSKVEGKRTGRRGTEGKSLGGSQDAGKEDRRAFIPEFRLGIDFRANGVTG